MSSSIFSEGEAPQDFRVSSTESDEHYTKCPLCYTVKKNFYCAKCVKSGGYSYSSMPYSDRFSEKEAKLLRLKLNRRIVMERCERILSVKLQKDSILTEAKIARDKIDLLKLAIEQRRNNIEEKKHELLALKQSNEELRLRLPRYQKRVASLGKHSQEQRLELHQHMTKYTEQAEFLAELRRSRIRQLFKYIFPVYMSYDISDSIEDLEFVGDDWETDPPKRSQLHIVSPWLNCDEDCSAIETWLTGSAEKEAALNPSPASSPAYRVSAALSLAAQLVMLLAWTLDSRLPHSLAIQEYGNWRISEDGTALRVRRLCACAASLCVRTALPPSLPSPLAGLHALALAATTGDHTLGRVETWTSESIEQAGAAWRAVLGAAVDCSDDDAEPEHLHWPEALELDEFSGTPPPIAPSLVESAAASIASMWRGWTK